MPAKKVRASKRHSQPATKASDTARIAIQNINVPGRSTRVDAAKYEAMRSALLKVLPAKRRRVLLRLRCSRPWYRISQPLSFAGAPKPAGGPRRFNSISRPSASSLARTPSLCGGTGPDR